MKCEVCSNPLSEGALFCGECGSSVYTQKVSARREPLDTQVLPRFLTDGLSSAGVPIPPVHVPEPEPEHVPEPMPEPMPERVETPQPRFTLTLDSGESLEVSANGLVGRMPQPAEGEWFAHLVIVTDPSRSVSKTHLEFGLDGEQLWVLDRNSGNGSIIRESGKIPRRADPGRKYIVPRGTRIDMGATQLLID